MALPLPSGLTPMEVAFLCEMETVTVVPRQRLESLDLLAGKTPILQPPKHTSIPLWLALLLKRQRRANILPPPWLHPQSLDRILKIETDNPEGFSPPPPLDRRTPSTVSPPFLPSNTADSSPDYLPYHWIDMGEILLEAASDDIQDPDKVRELLRDLREVRMAKMRSSTLAVEGGGLTSLQGVGAMEVSEGRGFITGVMDGLRKLGASREVSRREKEQEGTESGGDGDSEDEDMEL
ncbi:DNA replication protein psf2 [Ciborinia camelliae]|nr:DNA replication protein psf2 [Ciborinia camelliae]